MNVSRDLFLLAAIAFQQGDYDKSASLFASSMSSDDAEEFLNQVDQMADEDSLEETESTSSGKSSLRSIARILKKSMKATSESLSADDFDFEDEDEDTDSSAATEDSDEELESDDVDPDSPGERIIPAALSSVKSAIKVK